MPPSRPPARRSGAPGGQNRAPPSAPAGSTRPGLVRPGARRPRAARARSSLPCRSSAPGHGPRP
ncbi:MAG: hypothetical protein EOO75_01555 [Myxococcales bacterium]|nr:MAG: hypothetical protein EOO75_01555 [Myxococcales bacterium]